MDRKEYLQMCQKCALFKGDVFDIKPDIPDNLRVKYNGIEYYPFSYKMNFDYRGNPINMAILHDLNTRSVLEARLENVEKLLL